MTPEHVHEHDERHNGVHSCGTFDFQCVRLDIQAAVIQRPYLVSRAEFPVLVQTQHYSSTATKDQGKHGGRT